MDDIRPEMDKVIAELKKEGIGYHAHMQPGTIGLGDVVESVLNRMGITQERFKYWFNLKACNCEERKKYLNNLFSWYINNKENNE